MNIKPVVLIVLDGWGHRVETEHNAIAQAKTPFFDSMLEQYPHSLLDASEENVGLPEGQMGNSEVGHMTIGAGTVIDTDLVRITKSIRSGELAKNSVIAGLFEHAVNNNSALHLIGLVSPGGVHSNDQHLYTLLRAAKEAGVSNVVIHAITDGRDTPPQSAAKYIKALEDAVAEAGIGFIATASGRFYAMDRDKNWDRVSKAEEAIFHGTSARIHSGKASEIIAKLHGEGALDEHLEPIVFLDDSGKSFSIGDHDAVFFFNFRADRARQLSRRILEHFNGTDVKFATMTEYDRTFNVPVAFPQKKIETTLAAEISKAGKTQAHIAETEKYAHATYFLNGGRETPHEGEEHILVESRKDIPTHDLAPEMRAAGIAGKAIEQIEKGTDFIFINFANADMVGHTANSPAIIAAVEEVDTQLQRVVEAAAAAGGVAVITADHGNAELNIDPETGHKHTAHTLNVVPFIVTKRGLAAGKGSLADVAPTVLSLIGLPKPAAMTGQSLIQQL